VSFKPKTVLPLGSAIFFTALTLGVLFTLAHLNTNLRAAMQVLATIGLLLMLVGLVQLIVMKIKARRPAA
jgi:hypothetical protein